MAPQSLSSLKANLSATKRYGHAVVSVALALALALSLERYDCAMSLASCVTATPTISPCAASVEICAF
jgi:hypothetical protein